MSVEAEQEKQQEQYQQQLKIKMQRIFGIVGCLFGAFFIVTGLISYLHPDKDVKDIKLFHVYGTISRDPERHSPGRGEYINFELKDFPGFDFRLSGFALKALSVPLIGMVHRGDSILIQLDQYNYDKLKKSASHAIIEACAFRSREQIFVTSSDYMRRSIADNRLGIYIAILGFLLCSYYSRQLYLGFNAKNSD